MKSVKEIVIQSPYRGSEKTYEMVKEQIEARWGEAEAKSYDPNTDCAPYGSWLLHGYKVRKGEKALKSITFVEVKDEKDNIVRKIKRTVNLFHKCQVEKVA
jgi:uncharacterized protein YegL